MIPSLYTYNGHSINDGSNYTSKILAENQAQGNADAIFVKRPFNRPVYGGKQLNDYQMVISVDILTTPATKIDELKRWFDVEDLTPHKLVISDTNNSNKQYYIYATTSKFVQLSANACFITLAIADPVWTAVDQTSASAWSITASGQKKTVTAGGNVSAHPTISITPTAVKGSGFAYKRLVIVRNRTDEALSDYPLELTNGGWDATALLNYTTNHAHVGADITAGSTSIAYSSETGTLPSSGIAMIENEQISYTGKAGGSLTGCTRGINGTIAAAHASGTQINQSLIQADGNDIRVYVNNKLTPCWISGAGSSAQKVWISIDLKEKVETQVNTAINSGDIEVTLKNTNKLPDKGLILCGTELIRYTGRDTHTDKLTGLVRGACGTTAASHAANSAVYFIENEIWIYYGNITIDDPKTDYKTWDAKKPIIELYSSNTSWTYAVFRDAVGQRAGSWSKTVLDSDNNNDPVHKTRPYTGSRNEMESTATEMGAVISSWKSGSSWKNENATVVWELYNPCGVTNVSASGEKYRATSNWPSRARLEYSDDGDTWKAGWTTESSPSTTATWEALSAHSAISLSGSRKYLRFIFEGSVGASANNFAAISYKDVTLAQNDTTIPEIILGQETSNYHLNIRIRNNTTAESFKLDTGMLLNGTLEINCSTKTIKLSGANNEKDTEKTGAIYGFSSVRNQWLDLNPGANELQIDDLETTGTLQLTVQINWYDRNN